MEKKKNYKEQSNNIKNVRS